MLKKKRHYIKRIKIQLPNDFEKDEETSHEKEEEYLETIEYHSKTNSTMDVEERASTDGCLNYEGIPTDGCSHL